MPMETTEQDIKLLLIDDEDVIHKSVGGFLKRMGYTVECASDAEAGLEMFDEGGADIVISDIKMSGMDGMEMLEELRRRSEDTEVILITGHGDLDIAVDALRKGVFDFFRKPVALEELLACLQRTRRYREVRREKDRIQRRLDALMRSRDTQADPYEIIGESRVMQRVLELVDKVAQSDRTTVLIEGGSGTGKELVARAIHEKSPRASGPYISVNCTAIPEALVESELFGHERGAFTDARETRKGVFELGEGGSLFLDEIGDMGLSAQAKILRGIEERRVRRVGGDKEIPVDVRLISATNQNLQGLIDKGKFRQDLFFRLNVFTIPLPPLRERGGDVLLLTYHFLKQCASDLRKDIVAIEPEAQTLLRRYAFPGNVRELRNLIERAVILCDGASLGVRDFPDLASLRGKALPDEGGLPSLNLNKLEAQAIREAICRAGGKQIDAAKFLGIGHDALRYRMRKYEIE